MVPPAGSSPSNTSLAPPSEMSATVQGSRRPSMLAASEKLFTAL
jgi:hypothetical protein